MKLKTLLITPLIIVGLAYIGIKGVIYYKTKSGLDKMIQLASPFVQIDYSGIGSELSGSIIIDKLRITPTGTYDEVSIQQLKISGKNYKFLLDLMLGRRSNEILPQMRLSFQNLEGPVSSSYLSNLTARLGKDSGHARIETCSIPGILASVGLKDLGHTTITMNGNIGYAYDRETNQASFSVRYDLAGVESSLLELRLSQFSPAEISQLGKPPVIDEMRFVRQFEPEYMQQIIKHCASNVDLTPDAFIEDLFTQSDDYYLKTMGFIPGPGLSDLFKQLITKAGTVEVRATPASEIHPAILNAYRPEDLIDLFGVTARYNDVPITDLSFSMQSSMPKRKPKSPEVTGKPATPTPIVEPAQTKMPKPKAKPRLLYLDTDIADLKDYLNYKVRIYTHNNDIPKQGVLVYIDKRIANVEQLLFHGKMTSHLLLDRIERVEVLRRDEDTTR